MKRFPLDKNYAALLESYGISVEEILRRAGLPPDVFSRENPCLAAEEYFNFMQAVESLVQDSSFSAKIRSALVELLPAGKSAVEDVATALGIGKRTL